MAIRFKKNKLNITVDSGKIIGIMGKYNKFICSLNMNNIYFIQREFDFIKGNVYDELINYSSNVKKYLDMFNLDESFLKKSIRELSLSEKRILKYIEALMSNKNIIIIDEVYLYLDLFYKKKINILLKDEIKKNKTIFISSHNSDDICGLCDRLLLINDKKYHYDKAINVFRNNQLLIEYGIEKPEIVKFVDLCCQKGKKVNYTSDIRDVIKEVYKNV